MVATINADAGQPKPRLCHLRKWPDFSGYGFNLSSQKGRVGHFAVKIDADSPGQLGGLKETDRIVEVNGQNVEGLPHQRVADIIRLSLGGEVQLLVIDDKADKWFHENEILIHGNLDNVHYIRTPFPRPDSKINYAAAHLPQSLDTPILRKTRAESGFQRYSMPEPPEPVLSPLAASSSRPSPVYDQQHGDQTDNEEEEGDDCLYAGVGNGNDSLPPAYPSVPPPTSQYLLLPRPQSQPEPQFVSDQIYQEIAEVRPEVTAERSRVQSNSAVDSPVRSAKLASTQSNPKYDPKLPTDCPRPRLCHMNKASAQEYGFTVRAYRDKGDKFIIEVDEGSVAEKTGLREWDRLIEVNGINVGNENLKQVKGRINNSPNDLRLLVLREEEYMWYSNKGVVPKSSQPNVIALSTNEMLNAARGQPAREEASADVIATQAKVVTQTNVGTNALRRQQSIPETNAQRRESYMGLSVYRGEESNMDPNGPRGDNYTGSNAQRGETNFGPNAQRQESTISSKSHREESRVGEAAQEPIVTKTTTRLTTAAPESNMSPNGYRVESNAAPMTYRTEIYIPPKVKRQESNGPIAQRQESLVVRAATREPIVTKTDMRLTTAAPPPERRESLEDSDNNSDNESLPTLSSYTLHGQDFEPLDTTLPYSEANTLPITNMKKSNGVPVPMERIGSYYSDEKKHFSQNSVGERGGNGNERDDMLLRLTKLSVCQIRQVISARKKLDPRDDPINFAQRYEEFEKL